VDRPAQHRELVNAIRITAVNVDTESSGDPVRLPKIQVFAGVPIMPTMTSATIDGVSVQSSGSNNGILIFDKKVSGGDVPSVGSAAWYLNNGNVTRNCAAKNGVILRVLSGDYLSRSWLAVSFPSKRLLGYLYSIDDLSSVSGDHANTPYAASLYFEGRETYSNTAVTQDSIAGEWDEIDLISLDKCVGFNGNPSLTTVSLLADQGTLNTWAQNVLGLTGSGRENAYLVDETDWRIIRFKAQSSAWDDDDTQITSATDASHNVDNRTHYADFKSVLTMSQLRFTVQSVMNVARQLPNEPLVAMPEMQFFGLPANVINTGSVATVSYLKAEDSAGNLHDVLGRHQRLPFQASSRFRFYIGTVQNIKPTDRRLYLAVQNTSGQMITSSASIDDAYNSQPFRDISISGISGTSPAYFELYIFSTNDEKVILASGYVGGAL
jgi:hypothetical protein